MWGKESIFLCNTVVVFEMYILFCVCVCEGRSPMTVRALCPTSLCQKVVLQSLSHRRNETPSRCQDSLKSSVLTVAF